MTTRTFNGQSSTTAWDPLNRLTSVTQGSNTTSFIYDADGQRLLRKDSSSTTLYLDGTELTLTGGSTAGTRYYAHGGETVALRKSNGDVWMMGANHLASHAVAIKTGTTTVQRQRYLPFGGPRGAANQLPEERGFLGQVEDDSTALVYLNARYYDAPLMRFLSVDPLSDLANPQSLNVYSYAFNNPVSLSDASGLTPEDGNPYWVDDASHPDGGYTLDPLTGAHWNSTLQAWLDPLSGGVWDPATGLWTDPQNGAVFADGLGWVDLNTGCVWKGGGWACPTLPTTGGESTIAVLIDYGGYPGPPSAGGGSCPSLSNQSSTCLSGFTNTVGPNGNPNHVCTPTCYTGLGASITANAAKGKAAEEAVASMYRASGAQVFGQVSIKPFNGGGTVRADMVVYFPNGQFIVVEVKSGAGIYTRNQAAGYPSIMSSGGTPVGVNAAKAGFAPFEPIGATPVVTWYLP